MKSRVTGRVNLDGDPRGGVDVALVGTADRPLATAVTDTEGHFVLDAPAGFESGWVLARFREPFFGVAAVALDRPAVPVTLDVSSRSSATVTVKIALPKGAPFDMGDLDLDPAAIPGVPEHVLRVAGAVGGDDERRKTFRRVHLEKPDALVRLLKGTWLVEAHREVDGPTPAPFEEGPRNWESQQARLHGGKTVPREHGAHRIEVKQDLSVTLLCEESRP